MISKFKQIFIKQFLKNKFDVKFKYNTNLNLKNKFEGKNVICENVLLHSSKVGFASYIGPNCRMINTKIGKYSCIGPNVQVITGAHPTHTFVSIHPCFYSLKEQSGFTFVNKQKFEEFKYVDDSNEFFVDIGSDVWIGSDVKLLQGVTIGDGAIIGSGSVVTKDVDPYTISAGNPCKTIRDRFEKEEIRKLLELKWWDLPFSELKSKEQSFDNIKTFMKLNI